MYRFGFSDSGEMWEIEDDDFRWRPSYWIRAAIQEAKWFRHRFPDECQSFTFIDWYHDFDYIGLITVSDFAVHYAGIKKPEYKYHSCYVPRGEKRR